MQHLYKDGMECLAWGKVLLYGLSCYAIFHIYSDMLLQIVVIKLTHAQGTAAGSGPQQTIEL